MLFKSPRISEFFQRIPAPYPYMTLNFAYLAVNWKPDNMKKELILIIVLSDGYGRYGVRFNNVNP